MKIMGNWIELHQNEAPILVNLDNISMITPIEVRNQTGKMKTCLCFNDKENGCCDESYEEIKKLIHYLVP